MSSYLGLNNTIVWPFSLATFAITHLSTYGWNVRSKKLSIFHEELVHLIVRSNVDKDNKFFGFFNIYNSHITFN